MALLASSLPGLSLCAAHYAPNHMRDTFRHTAWLLLFERENVISLCSSLYVQSANIQNSQSVKPDLRSTPKSDFDEGFGNETLRINHQNNNK